MDGRKVALYLTTGEEIRRKITPELNESGGNTNRHGRTLLFWRHNENKAAIGRPCDVGFPPLCHSGALGVKQHPTVYRFSPATVVCVCTQPWKRGHGRLLCVLWHHTMCKRKPMRDKGQPLVSMVKQTYHFCQHSVPTVGEPTALALALGLGLYRITRYCVVAELYRIMTFCNRSFGQ